MSFASAAFVGFAAVLIFLYYVVPKKIQWAVLLAGSYFFYYFAGLDALAFIAVTTVSTYLVGLWLERRVRAEKTYLDALGDTVSKDEKKAYRERAKKKRFLILCAGLVLNFGILAVLKYTAFALDGINGLIRSFGYKSDLSVGWVIIPLGISFYIFQSMSYLIDVYRGKTQCERNFFRFALFVSFFPQLVQGPISRHKDLAPELYAPHKFSSDNFMAGGIRVAFGYFKKMVIADRVLVAVKAMVDAPDKYNGLYVVLLIILYSVQIYADFTGGMDITIGISRMLGIRLVENFDRPFSSKSTKEYWRRWHITMGSWFTDYVFYPLSVCKPMQKLSKFSREKLGKTVGKRIPVYLATIATWFLTGLWHGAGLNFIVWGLLNCLVILVSQELSPLYDKFHKACPRLVASRPYGVFMMARTFMLMGTIRILDVYRDVPLTFRMYGSAIVDAFGTDFSKARLLGLGLDVYDVVIIAVGVVLMYTVSKLTERVQKENSSLRVSDKIAARPIVFCALAVLLIISVIIFGEYGFGYTSSDFIYGQF